MADQLLETYANRKVAIDDIIRGETFSKIIFRSSMFISVDLKHLKIIIINFLRHKI